MNYNLILFDADGTLTPQREGSTGDFDFTILPNVRKKLAELHRLDIQLGICSNQSKSRSLEAIQEQFEWNSYNAPRIGSTEKPSTFSEAVEIIKALLRVLPNTTYYKDPSWEWCWNELSDAAQDGVILAAGKARNFLKDVGSTGNAQKDPCASCSDDCSSCKLWAELGATYTCKDFSVGH